MFPGSINFSAGTLAPTEPDNVIGSLTVEQGFTAWRRGGVFVAGFVDVTRRHDTQALSWNRTTPITAGFKIVNASRAGVVQVAAGVTAQEQQGRWTEPRKALNTSYWNAWTVNGPGAHRRLLPDAFPGQAYASSGYITAAEPDNWISAVSVRQGVTVARPWHVAVTPFVAAAASSDTSRFSWNNRSQWDAGLNLSTTVGSGLIEVGAATRHMFNRMTRESNAAPVIYANFWLGWNPRHLMK